MSTSNWLLEHHLLLQDWAFPMVVVSFMGVQTGGFGGAIGWCGWIPAVVVIVVVLFGCFSLALAASSAFVEARGAPRDPRLLALVDDLLSRAVHGVWLAEAHGEGLLAVLLVHLCLSRSESGLWLVSMGISHRGDTNLLARTPS